MPEGFIAARRECIKQSGSLSKGNLRMVIEATSPALPRVHSFCQRRAIGGFSARNQYVDPYFGEIDGGLMVSAGFFGNCAS